MQDITWCSPLAAAKASSGAYSISSIPPYGAFSAFLAWRSTVMVTRFIFSFIPCSSFYYFYCFSGQAANMLHFTWLWYSRLYLAGVFYHFGDRRLVTLAMDAMIDARTISAMPARMRWREDDILDMLEYAQLLIICQWRDSTIGAKSLKTEKNASLSRAY